ncbi:MAG TPA: redoxin domain-containing protein [Pirellulaceae bacterium]|nr:redoxin domain-containing protein [Pirellulaceae bacterium]
MVRDLERKTREWFEENASRSQRERLRQLECYAQGGRCLLREDVGDRIGLNPTQRSELVELARATDDAQQRLSRAQFGDPEIETLQATLTRNVSAERAAMTKTVSPEQREKLTALLGPPFDAGKLKRIYAMAPEFADAGNWINSDPLTSSDLRGKVVLVHFYAFQCHNCHANFAIYRRWHEELTDRGVVVIGIQTPETGAERDVEAVRAAAIERKLAFPIVVDLESKNWKAWGNTMWPTVYVVDKRGYIRHWWQGELNWKGATADEAIEAVVDELLAERVQ